MNQSINLRALRWAYDQNDLSVTAKAVLITLAMHADEYGSRTHRVHMGDGSRNRA